MSEIVLATRIAFEKGEEVFRHTRQFEIRKVPSDEESVAEAVLANRSRAVIIGSVPYRGPLYEALSKSAGSEPGLIARFGVGHDNVDKRVAREHNLFVTTTPRTLDISVAEHTMWLLGSLVKDLPASDARFRAGEFVAPQGSEVCGKTLGIVGFGQIGRAVARIAHFGFSMRVIAADQRSVAELEASEGIGIEQIKAALGVEQYTDDVDAVLRESDAVTIHVSASEATRNLIDARRLGLMKPSAVLINTSRGPVVDEAALYEALRARRIGGAALDVFLVEPYEPSPTGCDLRSLDNVVLSPHSASNTHEANRRMAEACVANVAHFLAGRIDKLSRVD